MLTISRSNRLSKEVRISDLDSTLKGFCLNLSKTFEKGGRPQEHVYFITRQGAGWNFAKFERNLQKKVDGTLKTTESGT